MEGRNTTLQKVLFSSSFQNASFSPSFFTNNLSGRKKAFSAPGIVLRTAKCSDTFSLSLSSTKTCRYQQPSSAPSSSLAPLKVLTLVAGWLAADGGGEIWLTFSKPKGQLFWRLHSDPKSDPVSDGCQLAKLLAPFLLLSLSVAMYGTVVGRGTELSNLWLQLHLIYRVPAKRAKWETFVNGRQSLGLPRGQTWTFSCCQVWNIRPP